MKYKLVVCGGTFDHLHKGHVSLLKLAFSLGKKVVIGVTSDNFAKSEKRKAKSEKQIEPFEKRKQAVLGFIKTLGVLNRAEIVEIDDLFGPTLSKNLLIDAIVVSDDTKKGAEIINEKRRKLGLKDLKIIVAPSVYAEDGKLISSERIRRGEIDRAGRLYVKRLWFEKNLILPEKLRKEFKKPFGVLDFNVLKHHSQFSLTAAVGDVTAKMFNQLKLNQKISVVDFKVARKNTFSNLSQLGFLGLEKIFKVENPSGSLTPALFNACKMAWKEKKQVIIQVEGEEDLAVLPLVLTASLNTIIYYGQPNEGLVKVVVSEEIKDKAYNLVRQFKVLK